MQRSCAQRFSWWLSLAMAVFALSALAAVALGTGIAHAEDGSPSTTGASPSTTSSTSVEHRSRKGPTTTNSDPKSTGTAKKPARHPSTKADEAEKTDKTDTVKKVKKTDKGETSGSTRHLTLAAQATSEDRGVQTADATPAPNAGRFGRQLAGLASDAGIIGASLVNNVAADAAAIIGPHQFAGVPYAIATGIAGTAGNVSKVLSGTPLNATSTGPFTVDYGVLDVLSFLTPTKVPAGANDPSIKVSAAHPLPVILVNGTVETQALNWSVGAPVLANAGYKVYTFNYGNTTPFPNYPIQSTADIRQSADELSKEVDEVLAATGAPKVILVGHSQGGGILPSYYINELGGADKVSQLIGLAPSNHGTDVDGLSGLQMLPIVGPLIFGVADLLGPALGQQLVTSPFQQVVYGDGDTRPGVLYTTIASRNDEVVTPYTQQALDGPAVTNVVLQDRYPGLPAGHVGVAFLSQTWSSVLDALASNPQANPLQRDELSAA